MQFGAQRRAVRIRSLELRLQLGEQPEHAIFRAGTLDIGVLTFALAIIHVEEFRSFHLSTPDFQAEPVFERRAKRVQAAIDAVRTVPGSEHRLDDAADVDMPRDRHRAVRPPPLAAHIVAVGTEVLVANG